jgi:hypothetical protein
VNAAAQLPTSPVAGVSLDFFRGKAAELARDIVMQIDGARALAHAYGLSDDQWDALRNSPAFKQLVLDTQVSLQGADGTMERIRRKAGLALEHALARRGLRFAQGRRRREAEQLGRAGAGAVPAQHLVPGVA